VLQRQIYEFLLERENMAFVGIGFEIDITIIESDKKCSKGNLDINQFDRLRVFLVVIARQFRVILVVAIFPGNIQIPKVKVLGQRPLHVHFLHIEF